MKKPVLPFVVSALLFFGTLSVFAITADDLARYLGVSSWQTVVDLPPESFLAEIYQIEGGVVTKRLIEGDRRWTKKEGLPLTVMVGTDQGKYRIVVAYGGGVTMSAGTAIETFSTTLSPSLPGNAGEGDYVLFGKPDPSKRSKSTTDVAYYSDGFLLRIKSVETR